MPSACFVCRAHVSMRWPTRRLRPWRSVVRAVLQMPWVVGSWARSLCVTVANALGGQRVAGVSAFASSLDQAPRIDEAVHHLADPALGNAEPVGKVVAGDHRVPGHEVQRPLLRRADAEGRRSLRPSAQDGAATPASRSGD